MLQAPQCYHESVRRRAVDQYMKLDHWNDDSIFKKLFHQIKTAFGVSGVAISVIDAARAHFKVASGLGINDIPRSLSIDGHAILSLGHFALLDAAQDWRTLNSPCVKGQPHMRFYCGVQLVTSRKIVIGVLSIFDYKPKSSFTTFDCDQMRLFAKQVMNLLDTPVKQTQVFQDRANLQNFNNELMELRQKLGRATSRKSLLMAVFEKDGSGGPYLPNLNFRYRKMSKTSEMECGARQHALWGDLYKIGCIKKAAMALCSRLCKTHNVETAFILEIRVAEPYLIATECFPKNATKIETDNYKYASRLTKKKGAECDVITRMVGHCTSLLLPPTLDNKVYYTALASEFGIEYRNRKKNSAYNSGIIMPFYRHPSMLIRRNALIATNKNIEVYLRSGGYAIVMLSKVSSHPFGAELVSEVYSNASVLRRLYIS